MEQTCDLLIQNCSLLQKDFTVADSCSVAVTGTRISGIYQAGDPLPVARETLNGTGKLLMPGLVDGHTHCCQQLLRGSVADEYPMIWTRILVPFESNLRPEDSYVSAQLACLEMIRYGTTAFADAGGVFMNRVADAVVESGMRAAIAKSTMDTGNAITGAMKETREESICNTEDLYQTYQGKGDGRLKIFFGIRQIMTCTPELIAMVRDHAAARNTGIHAHLCEHRDEVSFCLQNYQMRPVEFLDSLGVLGPNLLTAHNVLLSEHDIRILAERGVKIIHCPRCNLSNHGFPKTPLMLELGASVGLGTDGAAPSNADLFEEMKTLRYDSQAYWGLASFDPVVMRCKTLLQMAAQGGANALGWGEELGSVEVGKLADMVLLDISQPHIAPTQNLVNTLVGAACGRDVTDSVINGKVVMRNREVLTLDEEKILADAKQHMREILSRIRG